MDSHSQWDILPCPSYSSEKKNVPGFEDYVASACSQVYQVGRLPQQQKANLKQAFFVARGGGVFFDATNERTAHRRDRWF